MTRVCYSLQKMPMKACIICGEDIMKNHGYHTNKCPKCTVL